MTVKSSINENMKICFISEVYVQKQKDSHEKIIISLLFERTSLISRKSTKSKKTKILINTG